MSRPAHCPYCGAPVDGCYCTADGFTFDMVEELRAELEEGAQ